MNDSTMGDFLLPPGYKRPGIAAVLREASVVTETGRFIAKKRHDKRERKQTAYTNNPDRVADPVLLVPGFLAGDRTLSLMAATLRNRGFRTYRSHIRANVGCTQAAVADLESRLEAIAIRRGTRVQIVGHSLGGMLARGLATRRPDLISGIVTMGSPMRAPGAHHVSLTRGVDILTRLTKAGVPGLMSEDCVSGVCARQSFDESQELLGDGIAFTAIYSQRDGIVDWRACVDPQAHQVEVTASHVGMAVDPRVIDHVDAALRRPGIRVDSLTPLSERRDTARRLGHLGSVVEGGETA